MPNWCSTLIDAITKTTQVGGYRGEPSPHWNERGYMPVTPCSTGRPSIIWRRSKTSPKLLSFDRLEMDRARQHLQAVRHHQGALRHVPEPTGQCPEAEDLPVPLRPTTRQLHTVRVHELPCQLRDVGV